MNEIRGRTKLMGAAALLWLGAAAPLALAGEMEPPGPPGPTMKPLDQLETRRPIYAEMLPLTITDSGSYYLAENITTSGDGITVSAVEVTIDLNGFFLCGGTGSGITENTSGSEKGVTVRNGTVCDWGNHGLELYRNAHVENVRAVRNAVRGISVSLGSRIIDSLASENGSDGIYITTGLVTGTIARYNDDNGIYGYDGVMITDCFTERNGRNGIRVYEKSYVINNLSINNSQIVADKAGIFVEGIRNRIDSNSCNSNPVGIHVDGTDNNIIRNTATGNPIGYDIVTGNHVGPIGNAATATSPWANLK